MDLHKILKEGMLIKEFIQGQFGIEKENLRITYDGALALTPHPALFNNKLENKYITTDFSESQLEMITPVVNSIDEVYDSLFNIHSVVEEELAKKNEYLWPYSMPCKIPEESLIPIASYDQTEAGNAAREYRKGLAENGKSMQLISGIHFNFSFTNEFIQKLYSHLGLEKSLKEFKNSLYLRLARSFLLYRPLLVYAIGNSAIMHKEYPYQCGLVQPSSLDYANLPYGVSFRNGRCGYQNKEPIPVRYDHLCHYVSDIENAIQEGKIQSYSHYYSPIRLKVKQGKPNKKSYETDGIEYVEIRCIDLNPLTALGIDKRDLYFIHLFLLYCALNNVTLSTAELALLDEVHHCVAENGLNSKVGSCCDTVMNGSFHFQELLINIKKIAQELSLFDLVPEFKTALEFQWSKCENRSNHPAVILFEKIKKEGYLPVLTDFTKGYQASFIDQSFQYKGYEDLQLSTQILMRSALATGVEMEVLDRQENFLHLKWKDHVELVKEATKTSKDSYISMLIMENKTVTKELLRRQGVNVPKGIEVRATDDLEVAWEQFCQDPCVVKPKSTNFGLGITIFDQVTTYENFIQAIEYSLQFDNTVLIETFITGLEYRFLVIDGKISAVLHRRPASVLGDGKSSIKELIEEKNRDPLRGENYLKPLEKIKLETSEQLMLSRAHLTKESIPSKGQLVWLRANSNISSGGDSIDVTEIAHERFKQIAIFAAQSVGAAICGVDMMLDDLTNATSNYGIIELNFNPAIHMHCFPYEGKRRPIGHDMIYLLFNEMRS